MPIIAVIGGSGHAAAAATQPQPHPLAAGYTTAAGAHAPAPAAAPPPGGGARYHKNGCCRTETVVQLAKQHPVRAACVVVLLPLSLISGIWTTRSASDLLTPAGPSTSADNVPCPFAWYEHCSGHFALKKTPCRHARLICNCAHEKFSAHAHTPMTLRRHAGAEVLLVRHLYHLFWKGWNTHTFLAVETTEGLFRTELMPCGFITTGPWKRSPACCANTGDPHNWRNGTWHPRRCQRWCGTKFPGDGWGSYENIRPRPGSLKLGQLRIYENRTWQPHFTCWTLSRTVYDSVEPATGKKKKGPIIPRVAYRGRFDERESLWAEAPPPGPAPVNPAVPGATRPPPAVHAHKH